MKIRVDYSKTEMNAVFDAVKEMAATIDEEKAKKVEDARKDYNLMENIILKPYDKATKLTASTTYTEFEIGEEKLIKVIKFYSKVYSVYAPVFSALASFIKSFKALFDGARERTTHMSADFKNEMKQYQYDTEYRFVAYKDKNLCAVLKRTANGVDFDWTPWAWSDGFKKYHEAAEIIGVKADVDVRNLTLEEADKKFHEFLTNSGEIDEPAAEAETTEETEKDARPLNEFPKSSSTDSAIENNDLWF